jgi:hypothetical protein
MFTENLFTRILDLEDGWVVESVDTDFSGCTTNLMETGHKNNSFFWKNHLKRCLSNV